MIKIMIDTVRRWALPIVCSVVVLVPLARALGQELAPEESVLKEAEIVLVGTVVGPATLEGAVTAKGEAVTVKVEKFLRPEAPSMIYSFEGGNVTVQLREPGSLGPGDSATFYTRLGSMGRGLTVIELAHILIPDLGAMEERVMAAAAATESALAGLSNSELRARIQQADVVLLGRVTAIREMPAAALATEKQGPLSEHDPMWQQAVVEVQERIKGLEGETRRISVRFAASTDIRWFRSPKLTVGEERIFMLDRDRDVITAVALARLGVDAAMGTLVDRKNVLAKDQIERVKSLLRE